MQSVMHSASTTQWQLHHTVGIAAHLVPFWAKPRFHHFRPLQSACFGVAGTGWWPHGARLRTVRPQMLEKCWRNVGEMVDFDIDLTCCGSETVDMMFVWTYGTATLESTCHHCPSAWIIFLNRSMFKDVLWLLRIPCKSRYACAFAIFRNHEPSKLMTTRNDSCKSRYARALIICQLVWSKSHQGRGKAKLNEYMNWTGMSFFSWDFYRSMGK